MRKYTKAPPEVLVPEATKSPALITQIREYKLITPLYGGGVEASRVDPLTPIRGTEIRGQLRFWWRATRGGQWSSLEEMKKHEDEIWGKAHKKGAQPVTHEQTVQIEINVLNQESWTAITPFKVVKKKGQKQAEATKDYRNLSYAAFPLQPTREELQQADTPEREVYDGVEFEMSITFPADETIRKEITAALWAWETFGGIGARTRRGFGALQLVKINGKNNTDLPRSSRYADIRRWIESKLSHFIEKETFPPNVPHLSRTTQFKLTTQADTVMYVWDDLIRRLARFRQKRDQNNKERRWPESNEARAIVKDEQNEGKFPKAVMGLPIVLHLDDDNSFTIEGKTAGSERLASPIILRPVSWWDKQAFGLVVLLQGTQLHPEGLVASNSQHGERHDYTITIRTALTDSEARKIPALNGRTDVLQAFMDSL